MILGCPPSQWQPSRVYLVPDPRRPKKVKILGQGGTAQPMIFFFNGDIDQDIEIIGNYIPEN